MENETDNFSIAFVIVAIKFLGLNYAIQTDEF